MLQDHTHISALWGGPHRPDSLPSPGCAAVTLVFSSCWQRTHSLAPDASCPHTLPGPGLAAFSELSHDIPAGAPPQCPSPSPLHTAAFQSGVLRVARVGPKSCTDGETETQGGAGRTVTQVTTELGQEPRSPYSCPEVCPGGCEVLLVWRREDKAPGQEIGISVPLLLETADNLL